MKPRATLELTCTGPPPLSLPDGVSAESLEIFWVGVQIISWGQGGQLSAHIYVQSSSYDASNLFALVGGVISVHHTARLAGLYFLRKKEGMCLDFISSDRKVL